jgi:alcohol dehydrogenase (NADP+)
MNDVVLAETWDAMQDLVRCGLTSWIGVSNFGPAEIATLGPELPAANQIACSPWQPNLEVVDWCRQREIRLMAHSPLSSAAGLLSEPRLQELAARCRRSPAQIVLRWNVQRGLVPLPSSTDPGHIAENLRVLDFELDADFMAAINSMRRSAALEKAPI